MNSTLQRAIDDEIIHLIQKNDHKGKEMLFEHYSSLMYGMLLLSTDEKSADSLLQKAVHEICHTCHEFDQSKGGFRSFLLGIVQRHAAAHRAGSGLDHEKDLKQLVDLIKEHGNSDCDHVCSKMLELVYYKSYTASQLAAASGISDSDVRRNIRKALKNVKPQH